MKKKTTYLMNTFKMVHLFRDDLEKIEHLLKDELKAERFTVSTSGYEYDSISEIQPDTLSTNDLAIQTSHPYVSITLDKNSARLYFSENSLAEEGAFSELSTILKERQRVFVHNMTRLWYWPVLSFSSLFLELILPKNYIKSSWFGIVFIVFIVCLALWGGLSLRARISRYSTVDFVKKSARPNFFIRNRDQIALNLVFTIIGAVLGFLLSKAF